MVHRVPPIILIVEEHVGWWEIAGFIFSPQTVKRL
jgi:hypothetical protein